MNMFKPTKAESIDEYMAMLVDESVSSADIEKIIIQNGGKFLKDVCLFDVYQGKQIEEGKKSMAFSLQFQSKDKTLTDEEVEVPFHAILQKVETEFAAKLRS